MREFYIALACFIVVFIPTKSLDGQNCTSTSAEILVFTTADEGPGSLRAAIECANALAGANTIVFDIPGDGPHVIYTGSTSFSSLPVLYDDGTTIDARTQSGYDGSPLVILDGSQGVWTHPINAIFLQGDECAVFGLEIRHFPDDGIDLRGADHCVIQDNYIHHNGYEQDFFPGAPGTGPWNGCGIVVRLGSDNNQIDGNVIENNEYCGIIVRSTVANNSFGTLSPNYIRHNAAGIFIGSTATSIQLSQNELICNDTLGIYLQSGANNNISPPSITNATIDLISGKGMNGDLIEVFVSENENCPDAICQGGTYLGTAIVVGEDWTLAAPFADDLELLPGDLITATATDPFHNSSAYAACTVLAGISSCTSEDGNIIVSNTQDNGPGSLRAAIECANLTTGSNTILFEIPGAGPHTIFVGSENDEALPALLDPGTTIDATSQTGYGENGNLSPQIILDGSQANWSGPYNAIWVRGDYCEIYGLEIIHFPDDGIDVTAADHVRIGSVDKPNVIYNNGYETDYWPDAPGTGPWNGCGIVYKSGSSYGIIEGNFIGTNTIENIAGGNELCGIIIQNGGDHNLIASNVVAHHEQAIRISSGGWFNSIRQNALYCNDSIAIGLLGTANLNPTLPVIDSASLSYIAGRADSAAIVEVFIAADETCASGPCQGSIYLGSTIAGDSTWSLQAPFPSGVVLSDTNKITVTATDPLGNTSAFSFCKPVAESIVCNLSIEIENLQPTNCDLSNGSFSIIPIGGTGPYTVDIGAGPSGQLDYSDLDAGGYDLTLSDANGCIANLSVTVAPSTLVLANIGNMVSASCNESNGSFEINASGGQMPYYYDIGNGPVDYNVFDNLPGGDYQVTVTDAQSCETEISFTLPEIGGTNLSVQQTFNATCEMPNGAFVFEATGGTPPYTYDIGNGPSDSPVFDELSSGVYSVSVTDANGCQSADLFYLSNDGVAPVAEFSYTDDGATFNFSEASIGGGTLLWDFGDGNTSTAADPTHTYETSDTYQVCLEQTNECGSDINCESITVQLPLANVNVGGVIKKENGQLVALVEVEETNHTVQVTNEDGSYVYLDEAPQSDFLITPYKDINYLNGVTTFDLFKINQHILQIDILDSPYKIIAADANRNGSVTTFDIVMIRQVILQNVDTFPNNTSWRFVPEAYEFVDPTNPLAENFPEQLSLNNVIEDQLDEDFIAIKVGDVNLSADPTSLSMPEDSAQFFVKVLSESAEEILLQVDLQQATAISAMEGSLFFDPHHVQLIACDASTAEQIPAYQLRSNIFNFSWYSSSGQAVQKVGFTLRLKKLHADWQQGIHWGGAIPGRSYDATGKAYPLSWNWQEGAASTLKILPNPFRKCVSLLVEIAAEDQTKVEQVLQIFDAKGQLVEESNFVLRRGSNMISLNLGHLPMGTYLFTLGKLSGKLIKH